MRIQHNIAAMNAYRNYKTNNSSLNKNLEKLSSGYKINRAGDDAAGLAISEKMRAQITGLQGAQKNAKDGISLVQTAEGALQEVHDMLNRMYSLAEQSANGTYDVKLDRQQLQKEVESLRTEIDRIADSANFNGIALLDGSLSAASVSKTSGQNAGASTPAVAAKAAVSVTAAAATGAGAIKFKMAGIGTGTLVTSSLSATATASSDIANALATAVKTAFASFSYGKGYTVTVSGSVVTFEATSNGTIASWSATALANALGVTNTSAFVVATVQSGTASQKAKFTVTVKASVVDTAATKLQKFTATIGTQTVVGSVFATSADASVYNNLASKYLTAISASANFSATAAASAGVGTIRFTAVTSGTYTTASALASALSLSASALTDVTLGKASGSATPSTGAKTTIDFTGKVGQDVWGASVVIGKGSTALKYMFVEKAGDCTDTSYTEVVVGKADAASAIASKLGAAITGGVTEAFNGVTKNFNFAANATGTAATAATDAGKLNFISTEVGADAYAVDIAVGGGLRLQIGDTAEAFNQMSVGINNMHAENMGIGDIDISTQNGAAAALDKIKDAINYVSDTRGSLGALQNRLDHTINNLSVMEENITDAESTIRDTDVAEEMMKYTKNNILNQAAQAMLAQANQQPQGVLQLLQ